MKHHERLFSQVSAAAVSVLTDTLILFHFIYLFFFIVIKLTSYDRQNEPINHTLRAGQESSHFRLPMKAVRLL